MKHIEITPTVRLTCEGPCVTIEQAVVAKTGKSAGETRWDSVGFYGDVKSAAQALLGRHHALIAGLGQDSSLRELISSVNAGAELVAKAGA